MVGAQTLRVFQLSTLQPLSRQALPSTTSAKQLRSFATPRNCRDVPQRALSLGRQGQIARRLSHRAAASTAESDASTATAVKEVPGSWDTPGYEKDYADFFYEQGWYEYYVSRQKQYGNVFRVNVGPTPDEAKFIALLDQSAFPIVLDSTKVHKKNVFFGDYMPDQAIFTNGERVCSYLDPIEDPDHLKIKSYVIALLAKFGPRHLSTPAPLFDKLFKDWTDAIDKDGKVEVCGPLLQFMWDWHIVSFGGPKKLQDWEEAGKPSILSSLPWGKNEWEKYSKHANDWASAALTPIVSLPGPPLVQKLLRKVLPLKAKIQSPKEDIDALMTYFSTELPEAVELGVTMGLPKEKALTNLTFVIAFNARNALASCFSNALIEFALLDKPTKAEMVAEVGAALKKSKGGVTFQAVQEMPLVESFVYELFRCHPPVSSQHGIVKEDTVIQSNTGSYQLRAGDKVMGLNYFCSRDPAIFDKPDTFVARRFLGEGKAKLKNVIWSNGFQTVPYEDTLNNKQCPGKDLVPLLVRVFMAYLLQKYKDVDITPETAGWSKTAAVPGPMLKSYKAGPELVVTKLTPV